MTHASLAALIARHGYWAVLIGSVLEGETIVLMGGFSAHRGYLHLPGVALAAFAGSIAGDQAAYLLGRRFGEPVLARRPKWRPLVAEVRARLHERGTWLLVGFRFLYGVRNAVPFVAGLTGIAPRRFLPLNVLGAALWAPTITLAGYAFGQAVETFLGRARRYEGLALMAIVVLGAFLLAKRRARSV